MKLLQIEPAALELLVGKRDRQTGMYRRPNDSLSERAIAVDAEASAIAGMREAQQRFSGDLGTLRAR